MPVPSANVGVAIPTPKLEPLNVSALPVVSALVLDAYTTPFAVKDVRPVPPFAVGNAVPDKLTANVPLVVIGEPDTDRKDGTDIATDVTVPKGFVAQEVLEPSVVRYLPLLPV